MKDFSHPWLKSTRQRAKLKSRDRPASGTLPWTGKRMPTTMALRLQKDLLRIPSGCLRKSQPIAVSSPRLSASMARSIWTLNQQRTDEFLDRQSGEELDEALSQLGHAFSAIVAQTMNTILSVLAWITRPIASVIDAASGRYGQAQHEGSSHAPVYQQTQYDPRFNTSHVPIYPPTEYPSHNPYTTQYR